MAGAGGGFPGAFVDAGHVAEQADGLVGVQVVVVVVAVSFQHVQELEDEVQVHPVIGGHEGPPPAVAPGGRADVGGGAGAGGGFPAVAGAVAGDIELVVVQGGGGAPVPGDGAAAGEGGGAAFGAGAFGGAFVPPGVVDGR